MLTGPSLTLPYGTWTFSRNLLMVAACFFITSCSKPKPSAADELNIYGWTDYHDAALIRDFTRKTGIRVRYDMFDSSDAAEAKLLVGGSGYDIMTVSNPYLGRQIKIGLYQELDRSLLPAWGNLDPEILKQIAIFDPDNRHALPYVWGITGTIYNIEAVAARVPDAPLDSLAMFFDPNVVSKFADCGVSIFDLPFSVYQMALAYLGRDPNQFTDDNLDAAQKQLLQVRRYIRKFDTDNWSQTLLDGDVCVAMGWPGTLSRILAETPPAQIKGHFNAVIPKGSELYFDDLAILADAPHKAAAYKYFQFLLDAHNAAAHINRIRYAVGNRAATPFVAPTILNNPSFYPPAHILKNAHQQMTVPPEFQRKMTRYWTELKAQRP